MVIIKRQIKILIFVLLFIIIAPLVVLYANGDIFADGWNILPTGGIYVEKTPTGSEIYLNGKLKDTTSFFSRNFLIRDLEPGNYQVSVKKDMYNSWTEKISVSTNLVADASVFMLPEKVDQNGILKYLTADNNIATSTITKKKNPEYSEISELFATSSLVTVEKPFSTSTIDFTDNFGTDYSPIMDNQLGLWQKNGKIYVQWFGDDDSAPEYLCNKLDCTESLLVYDNASVPTSIGFLPGYYDAIVIASGNKIFAVQAQNYSAKVPQIIYQGIHPDFRIHDGNLYIKDNGVLLQAVI